MLLYLARHAQTASSAVDSFNGQGELPLTEHGKEQARKLGARLAGIQWAAVYRSPLGRTRETAELIAPGIDSAPLPGLIEINYGNWEGLSPEQARGRRDRGPGGGARARGAGGDPLPPRSIGQAGARRFAQSDAPHPGCGADRRAHLAVPHALGAGRVRAESR